MKGRHAQQELSLRNYRYRYRKQRTPAIRREQRTRDPIRSRIRIVYETIACHSHAIIIANVLPCVICQSRRQQPCEKKKQQRAKVREIKPIHISQVSSSRMRVNKRKKKRPQWMLLNKIILPFRSSVSSYHIFHPTHHKPDYCKEKQTIQFRWFKNK